MVQCSQLMVLNPRSGTLAPPLRPHVPPCPGAAAGSARSAAVMATFFTIPIYRSPLGCDRVSRRVCCALGDRSFGRLVAALVRGTWHLALGTWHFPSEPDHALLRRRVRPGGGALLGPGAVEGGENAGGDRVVGVHPHHLVGGGAQHGRGDLAPLLPLRPRGRARRLRQ